MRAERSRPSDFKKLNLRPIQSVPRSAKDGKIRFCFAEPQDRGTDPLPELKFEAKSPNGIAKEAFKGLHPLGSGTIKKVETGQADVFELKQGGAGQR